jgi:acetyl-CoA carboxylase beta subunit
MDRIYTNHRHGERRIHVEIDENEIADLLDDLDPADPDAFHATKHLVELLKAANTAFGNDRQRDAHDAETSRT